MESLQSGGTEKQNGECTVTYSQQHHVHCGLRAYGIRNIPAFAFVDILCFLVYLIPERHKSQ